jgi:folate-dependent phosphoribosylglycinamide formyltransferase PurN
MRVVGLSFLDADSRLFYERLAETVPIASIIHVTPGSKSASSAPRPGRWRRVARAPQKVLRRHLSRSLRRVWDPSRRPQPDSAPPRIDVPCIPLPSDEVNTSAGVELLKSQAPDVLVTNCCPILKPEVFSVASRAAVNIHYGIAPEYRGQDTIFWALYRKDFERVGVTIHSLDRSVDGGEVLAWAYPDVGPGDDEVTLISRSSEIAAEAMAAVLGEMERGRVRGTPQQRTIRAFARDDRAFWHDALYFVRRRWLHENLSPRTAHVDLACLTAVTG